MKLVQTMLYENVLRERSCRPAPRLHTSRGHNGYAVGSTCIYCSSPLNSFEKQGMAGYSDGMYEISRYRQLFVCDVCGWWAVDEMQRIVEDDWYHRITHHRRVGVLRNLDIKDITVPLSELQRYLSVRFDKIGSVSPERVEKLVASIFRNHGYSATVTGRSGDGGIDIMLLDSSDHSQIGVQVKRYKASIEVEQVHAFAGALLIKGLRRGVFVTTSRYRAGAARDAKRFASLQPFGLSIELWDAQRLLTELKSTSPAPYSGPDDPIAPFYPFFNGEKPLIRYYDGWGYTP